MLGQEKIIMSKLLDCLVYKNNSELAKLNAELRNLDSDFRDLFVYKYYDGEGYNDGYICIATKYGRDEKVVPDMMLRHEMNWHLRGDIIHHGLAMHVGFRGDMGGNVSIGMTNYGMPLVEFGPKTSQISIVNAIREIANDYVNDILDIQADEVDRIIGKEPNQSSKMQTTPPFPEDT